MGLDMYLESERYVSEFFDEGDKERIEQLNKLFPEFAKFGVNGVRAQVAYWRKANQIHRWFVTNVQDGVDDCGYYYVSREQLKELRDLCQEVLNDQTLAYKLPPQEGFFFGSTEVDEYYFKDLESTVRQIDEVLKIPVGVAFFYHSSW